MGSISNGDRHKEVIREEQAASSTDGHNLSTLGDFIPLYVSTAEMDHTDQSSRRSSRFRVPFVGKINWRGKIKSFRHWLRDPGNVGMFIWLVVVVAGIILLSLLMLGALDSAIPDSTRRKKWIEVTNQMLNPLFMVLCLYEHPKLFYHLALVLRWRPGDAAELRRSYCKDGGPRPHERAHLLVVLLLLHSCFFATYVLCALYWAFSRTSRPDWAVNLAIGVAIAPLIIAGVYLVKSPLGKKYETDVELQHRQATPPAMPDQAELDRIHRKIVVTNPQWVGGLFDCRGDVTVAVSSFCCTFCVFGWNLERLGFGNMYVHIATFMLLCISPFFVFGAAYLSIDNDVVKYVAGAVGIVLCFFGLLYAGYYRIQMRKKFKLPGNKYCCGSATVTDCLSWQFCWPFALSQEVRTANFYEIGDESFYRRDVEDEEGRGQIRMLPMSREGGISPAKTGTDDISLLGQAYTTRANTYVEPHVTRPPVHQLIQLGEREGGA